MSVKRGLAVAAVVASGGALLGSAMKVEENPFPQLLQLVKGWAEGVLREKGELDAASVSALASEYPYFNFMPMLEAKAVPGQEQPSAWSAPCFADNSATFTYTGEYSGVVDIQSSNPSASGCEDAYLLISATTLKTISITESGKSSIEWELPSDIREAESWDLNNKGVRIMRFNNSLHVSAANALKTFEMFIPEFTQQVGPVSAKINVDFMAKYPQFKMEERDPLSNLPPPEHMVHSGDFFGIIRLDGLDPMLAWAMGSTTGHTTTALWIDGELFICESTVVDSYWPTDGIQKTPYKTWLKQAAEAGYNVVHVPLSKKYRAKFDESRALDWFNTVEGLEYGYKTMLWGWIDTLKDNYPCVPPDYSSVCLTWELVEPLFAHIDRYVPDVSSMLYNDAWNKRVGQTDLRTAEIYKAAFDMGIDSAVIPTIVEQDSWVYNTTRYGEPAVGRSMVCCVFVCSMWKNAGLFDGLDVNCAELTNWDDYALDIFEDSYSQIVGRYTLELNDFHTKSPYSHMAESCASEAPLYEKDPKC